MTPGKRDFYVSGLQAGILSPEQQIALAAELVPLLIKHKVMETTLNEIFENAREQDGLDRLQDAINQSARAGKITNVVPIRPGPAP